MTSRASIITHMSGKHQLVKSLRLHGATFFQRTSCIQASTCQVEQTPCKCRKSTPRILHQMMLVACKVAQTPCARWKSTPCILSVCLCVCVLSCSYSLLYSYLLVRLKHSIAADFHINSPASGDTGNLFMQPLLARPEPALTNNARLIPVNLFLQPLLVGRNLL